MPPSLKHVEVLVIHDIPMGRYVRDRSISEGTSQTPEVFHFDNFKVRDGKLYYRDKNTPLMIKGGSWDWLVS